MRILFDHGTPTGLARTLPGHAVTTAQAQGWDRLSNADLLTEAEAVGFDLLITTDRRIRYEQNLSGRRIALIALAGSTIWSRILLHLQDIGAAVEGVTPGSYRVVAWWWIEVTTYPLFICTRPEVLIIGRQGTRSEVPARS